MALFMYATISIFNIIDKDWEPYTLYLSSIFSIPFLLFGYIYYRMMKKVDENPFSWFYIIIYYYNLKINY